MARGNFLTLGELSACEEIAVQTAIRGGNFWQATNGSEP